ncbi:cell death abnormality protein 1-like [Mytilus californianus]|uniref:cell death abnormality protein 1-like n=1 Tax=Mytilus californianus TaxID=6549 RepID=UPI00224521A2|nr:cell death abnormality protein 1-like [Mytilus californianus]
MLCRNGFSYKVVIVVVYCLHVSVYLDIITALHPNESGVCSNRKNGSNWLTCCQGYLYEQADDRCTVCPVGTFGDNCKDNCPPNYYGIMCNKACNCMDGERCDKASGCVSVQPQECQSGKYLANCSDECQSNFQDIRCQSNCNCTSKDFCEKVKACFSNENIADMVVMLLIGISSGVFVLSLIIVTKCLKLRMTRNVDRRSFHSIPYDRREVSSEYVVMDNNESYRLYPLISMTDINMVQNAESSLYGVIDDTSIHTNQHNFNEYIPVNEYQNTSALSQTSNQSLLNDGQGNLHVYDTPHLHVHDIHRCNRLNDIPRPNQVRSPNENGAYSLQRSHGGLYSFNFL